MLVVSFVSVLATILLATTEAAPCSNETMMVLQDKPELKTAETACANLSNITAAGATMANFEKVCKESACMKTLADSYYSFPDCTIEGVNLQDYYQTLYRTIRDSCSQYVGVTLPRPTEASSAMSSGISITLVTAAAVVGAVALGI